MISCTAATLLRCSWSAALDDWQMVCLAKNKLLETLRATGKLRVHLPAQPTTDMVLFFAVLPAGFHQNGFLGSTGAASEAEFQ